MSHGGFMRAAISAGAVARAAKLRRLSKSPDSFRSGFRPRAWCILGMRFRFEAFWLTAKS